MSPDTGPTKTYICPSLSLMLPLNIGLPKTPHGLSIDRCLKPCPSPDPVLPQHWPNQDHYVLTQCYLNTGPVKTTEPWPLSLYLLPGVCHGVKLKELHQMAGTINSSFGGCVIQWCCFWVIPKITGGFRVLAPFRIPSTRLPGCQVFISKNLCSLCVVHIDPDCLNDVTICFLKLNFNFLKSMFACFISSYSK